MTYELARVSRSLAPVEPIDSAAAGRAATGLLARRLDRLRSASAGDRRPRFGGERGKSARRRATALAGAVDGSLRETGEGAVVVVESAFELPLARDALAELPFELPAREPVVCLDLETTGLGTGSGTVAFLVGIGTWHGDHLRVSQLLLPDHADERALLAALDGAIPNGGWLVTYNGRSFDWPLLVARFRLHRREPPLPGGHLDLLPVARQLWRHRLDNARLATVEAAICGVAREGDLPGALIPERYFSYLRLRRGELLRDVLEHNRQDIVSLGRLLQVLGGTVARHVTGEPLHPGDLRGLARAYARRGRTEEALACLEGALRSPDWEHGLIGGAQLYRRLATERATTLARLGRREEALSAWHELAGRGGPGAALAWIRIASDHEHVRRDIPAALAACRRAADVAARSRAWGRPLVAVERDLRSRLPRLQRRLHGQRRRSRPPSPTSQQRAVA